MTSNNLHEHKQTYIHVLTCIHMLQHIFSITSVNSHQRTNKRPQRLWNAIKCCMPRQPFFRLQLFQSGNAFKILLIKCHRPMAAIARMSRAEKCCKKCWTPSPLLCHYTCICICKWRSGSIVWYIGIF